MAKRGRLPVSLTLVLLCCYEITQVQPANDFASFDDYMNQWTAQFPQESKKMYPFGEYFLDTSVREGLDPAIDFIVPFYGAKFEAIFISENGHIQLSNTKPATEVGFVKDTWPNQAYPDFPDPPIIAPFYARADFRKTDTYEPARILYRKLQWSSGGGVDNWIQNGMLEIFSEQIREAVIGSDHFTADNAILITWYMTTLNGSPCQTNSQMDQCSRNTYQVALVTDGVKTFVIFNYWNIEWANGSDMYCDPQTGTNANGNLNCIAAQVGFNAGEAREFTSLPFSRHMDVLKIDDVGGSFIPGRFFFDITGDTLVRGGCTNDTTLGNNPWDLQVTPSYGGMFGGKEVNVSGPCFLDVDRIMCRFGDVSTNGWVDQNRMRATCHVPAQSVIGRVNMGVSTDGGTNYYFNTNFIVGYMGHIDHRITVRTTDNNWITPTEVVLGWTPEHITWKLGEAVDIKVFGYSETVDGRMEVEELQTVVSATTNTGYFTIYPAQMQCGGPPNPHLRCTNYDIGAIQISVQNSNPQSPRCIWSDMIPLGWFTNTELTKALGSSWPRDKCRTWNNGDIQSPPWMDGLWACPCELDQALSDFGRFQPDAYCDMNKVSSQACHLHEGAQHCVRAVTTTEVGAGTHCCYDVRGRLMYTGDTIDGSTPDRSHPWGKPPYGAPPYIPTVSHWERDIVPYFVCCSYQTDTEFDCFNYFVAVRPTIDCKNYRLPGQAAVFGDPHFVTFDGTVYTFNGHGEFWLMKTDDVTIMGQNTNFKLQARMEQPTQWGSDVRATIVTSVAGQSGSGSTVEIRLNPNHQNEDTKLHVLYNGDLIYFPDFDASWQDFYDVMVINNDPQGSSTRANFTVVFRAGVGFQVSYKSGLMHVLASATPDFFGRSFGLFGRWNGATGDDLTPSGGGQSIPADDLSRIHDQFGWTWDISESESLFTYRARLTHGHYRRRDFVPVFQASDSQGSCGDNFPCSYDLALLGDQAVSSETLQIQEWVSQLHHMSQPVVTCGWLSVANSVKQEPVDYYVGGVVTITGCRHGFKLSGPTRYECVSTGDGTAAWSPTITTQCNDESQEKEQEVRMATIIGVAAGLVFVILVIGIIMACCYCRKHRNQANAVEKEKKKAKKQPDESANDEFFTEFHDIKTKPTRPPRPAIRNQIPPLDNDSYDSVVKTNMYAHRARSTENLNLTPSDANESFQMSTPQGSIGGDRPDFVPPGRQEYNKSGTASKKKRRPPYQYPQHTGTAGRSAPPYRYPRNTDTLTAEERAIMEMNAQGYSETEA